MRLDIEVFQESYHTHLTKGVYTSPVANRSKNTLDWIMNVDEQHHPERREDVTDHVEQVCLFQEVSRKNLQTIYVSNSKKS
jgi:hypothetical protein